MPGASPRALAQTLIHPLARMLPTQRWQQQVYRLGEKSPPVGSMMGHSPYWAITELQLDPFATQQVRMNLQPDYHWLAVTSSSFLMPQTSQLQFPISAISRASATSNWIITAANTLLPGDVITLSGLTTAPELNGVTRTIITGTIQAKNFAVTGAATSTSTVSLQVNVGDVVVIFTRSFTVPPSASDNLGNLYTLLGSEMSTSQVSCFVSRITTAGNSTITISAGNLSGFWAVVQSYSGVGQVGSFVASIPNISASPFTLTPVSVQTGNLVVAGLITVSAATTFSPFGGSIIRNSGNVTLVTTPVTLAIAENIALATGPLSVQGQMLPSTSVRGASIVLTPASTSPIPPVAGALATPDSVSLQTTSTTVIPADTPETGFINATRSTTPTQQNGAFRAQIYDTAKALRMADRGVRLANLGGNSGAIMWLRDPYHFDLPDSQVILVVQNLENATNQIQIAMYGQVLRFNQVPGTM